MDSTSLLSLGGLNAWYTPGRPVLTGLSLDLGPREVVGLIGRNGAGKTTLFRVLAGLLSGCRLDRAAWEGRPVSFRDDRFKRDRFVVFAEERSFPYFTFRDYLAYAADAYGRPLPAVSALVRGFRFEEYTQSSSGSCPPATGKRPPSSPPLPWAPDCCCWTSRSTAWISRARSFCISSWEATNRWGPCCFLPTF